MPLFGKGKEKDAAPDSASESAPDSLSTAKRRARTSLEKSDIPSRNSSLIRGRHAGVETIPERRSSLDGGPSDLVSATRRLSINGRESLEQQRKDLVTSIVSTARHRAEVVNDEGRRVFQAAGLPLKQGSVEVTTRWIQPVIQETFIPKEHVETTIVVERDVHIHHVYPKIQPISDPDPIILETRHRICDANGRWHEVIGDAAAIEILGDAFHSGQKETREKRTPALPGLEQTDKEPPDQPAVWQDKDGRYSYDTGERRTLSMEI